MKCGVFEINGRYDPHTRIISSVDFDNNHNNFFFQITLICMQTQLPFKKQGTQERGFSIKSFIGITLPKMLKACLCFPQGFMEFCAASDFRIAS